MNKPIIDWDKMADRYKRLKAKNKRLRNALKRILEIKRCLPMDTKPESAQMAEVAKQALAKGWKVRSKIEKF